MPLGGCWLARNEPGHLSSDTHRRGWPADWSPSCRDGKYLPEPLAPLLQHGLTGTTYNCLQAVNETMECLSPAQKINADRRDNAAASRMQAFAKASCLLMATNLL